MPAGTLIKVSSGKKVAFSKRPKIHNFRTVYKATASNKRRAMVPRNIRPAYTGASPFPLSKIAAVVYSDNRVMNTGTLSLFGNEHAYALNGLFDPDITGFGHQPYGYDQLMAIYAAYKVHAVKVELTWTNATQNGMTVGYKMSPIGDNTALAGMSWAKATESPSTQVRPINADNHGVVKQSFMIPMHMLANVTKLQFNAEPNLYSGTVSANPLPPNTALLRVAAVVPQSITDATVEVRIRITYFTRFYNRLTLGQS